MTPELFELLDFIQDGSAVLLLCWLRIWVIFKVIPFFAGPSLPSMVRNVVTVSLAMIMYPIVYVEMLSVPIVDFFWFFSIVVKEAFLGFVIGHTIGIVFMAVGGIGFLIDNQRGASMASSMNPLLGEQDSPLGIFLSQVLVTLLFVSGGILAIYEGIYSSFIFWPPTTYFPNLYIGSAIYYLEELDHLMYLITFLSAPVLICMFLAEFGLAMVGRFAPQLNVFFLAMPIKSGIALFVLILYVRILMEYFDKDFTKFSYIPHILEDVFK